MTEPARLDPDAEFKARRRKRNIALALILGVLVVLFYAMTIIKLGPSLFQRPL